LDWGRAGPEGRKPPIEEKWGTGETRCSEGRDWNLVEPHHRWRGRDFHCGFDGRQIQAARIIEHELATNRWRWWTRIRFDQNITAVFFHLSLPADVGDGFMTA
jgi:hypothetical protein